MIYHALKLRVLCVNDFCFVNVPRIHSYRMKFEGLSKTLQVKKKTVEFFRNFRDTNVYDNNGTCR